PWNLSVVALQAANGLGMVALGLTVMLAVPERSALRCRIAWLFHCRLCAVLRLRCRRRVALPRARKRSTGDDPRFASPARDALRTNCNNAASSHEVASALA